jgi:glycosyltransferase involved in cell wall biosynthesis
MVTKAYVFVGGLFTAARLPMIVSHSRGPVQHAADGLQKAMLAGLATTAAGRDLIALNLPFIGSWPGGYSRAWYRAATGEIEAGVPVIERSFLNVRFLRAFWRLAATLAGLVKSRTEPPRVIIVYSANTPFVAAAWLYKLAFPQTRICLVLPDLLEFMAEGSWRYRLLKAIEGGIFDLLRRRVDYFVLLSRHMAERLHLAEGRYVVVEGMVTSVAAPNLALPPVMTPGPRSFLYTGTLARRYGLGDLLDAFARLPDADLELWICGDGDGRADVEAAALKDRRIHYVGQVTRDLAVAMQRRAGVLVNPRRPEGAYTRYSFPSKTIEYLAAGRPVIMHALAGVPADYHPHLIIPQTPDVEGLALAMGRTIALPAEDLRAIGARGRDFVTTRKSPHVQCSRIVELIG